MCNRESLRNSQLATYNVLVGRAVLIFRNTLKVIAAITVVCVFYLICFYYEISNVYLKSCCQYKFHYS